MAPLRRSTLLGLCSLATLGVGLGLVVLFRSAPPAPPAESPDHASPASSEAPVEESGLEEVVETAAAEPAASNREALPTGEVGDPDPTLDGVDDADLLWITGRVELPPGTPVDEEIVIVARGKSFSNGGFHRARVADDGTFRSAFHRKTGRGRLQLEARHLYLPEKVKVHPKRPPEELVLQPELGGRVEVTFVPSSGDGWTPEDLGAVRLVLEGQEVTRVDGGLEPVVFEAVPASDSCLLEGTFTRYVDSKHVLSVRPGETTGFDLVLDPGATVRGRVTDERGTPLEGISVWADVRDSPSHVPGPESRSLEDGSFELVGVRPGNVTILARRIGHLSALEDLGDLESLDVRTDLTLILDRGQAISGRVLRADGSPAVSARVQLHPDRSRLSRSQLLERRGRIQSVQSAVAAEDGSFRFAGLEDGYVYAIAASERGPKVQGQRKRSESHARIVEVAPGTSGLVLKLSDGAGFTGTVADDAGRPVDRFFVQLHPVGGEIGRSAVNRRFRRAAGRFELSDIEPGVWRVEVLAFGGSKSEPREIELPGAGELRFVVPRSAEVQGVVRDAEGSPLAGALVKAIPAQRFGSLSDFGIESTKSKANGVFVMKNLPPGPVVFQAEHEDWAKSQAVERVVEAGEKLQGLELGLLEPGYVVVEIHPSLDPGPGARVAVSLRSGIKNLESKALMAVDRKRPLRTGPLEPGPYAVTLRTELSSEEALARGARFEPFHVEVEGGKTSKVVLGGDAAHVDLHGHVTLDGAAVEGAQLRLQRAFSLEIYGGVEPPPIFTDAEGRFSVRLGRPGEYWVTVTHGEQRTHAKVQVPAEPRFDWSIDIEREEGGIDGFVEASGAPVPQATVWLYGSTSTERPYRNAQVEHGRFSFDDVGPGSYRILAWRSRPPEESDGGRWAGLSEEIQLERGAQRGGVRIELLRSGLIEGRVVDEAGFLRPKAQLVVVSRRDERVLPWFGGGVFRSARFQLSNLPPGRYGVAARLGDLQSPFVEVDLLSGAKEKIQLVLPRAEPR